MARVLPDTVLVVAALLVPVGAMAGGARSVIGSCADGSVVFATKWEDVRCEGAVRMPPSYVPGVASWQDRAVVVDEVTREGDIDRQITESLARLRAASPPVRVEVAPGDHAELVDLVSRGGAPAAAVIEHGRSVGSPDRMRLAHSPWFEAGLRDGLARSGMSEGPVLVFQLESSTEKPRPRVPAFAQGGVTFRPDSRDPHQLGWIESGRPSPGGGPRLGYVVLPAGFDANRPLVIFWGDAVVATRLWRED